MLRGFLLGTMIWTGLIIAWLGSGVERPRKQAPQVVQLPAKVIRSTTQETKQRTVTVKVPAKRPSTAPAPPRVYRPVLRPQVVVNQPAAPGTAPKPRCAAGTIATATKVNGVESWSCKPDRGRPQTPKAPVPTAGDGRVLLSWTAVQDPGGIRYYRVYRNGQLLRTTRKTSYTDNSVISNALYTYRIDAVDRAGNRSRPSKTVRVVLSDEDPGGPDPEPPGQPANLGWEADKAGPRISLNWIASQDNRGVSYYRIYRGGELLGVSTEANYVDTAVEHGKEYHYAVAAVDEAGNISERSPEVATYVS